MNLGYLTESFYHIKQRVLVTCPLISLKHCRSTQGVLIPFRFPVHACRAEYIPGISALLRSVSSVIRRTLLCLETVFTLT